MRAGGAGGEDPTLGARGPPRARAPSSPAGGALGAACLTSDVPPPPWPRTSPWLATCAVIAGGAPPSLPVRPRSLGGARTCGEVEGRPQHHSPPSPLHLRAFSAPRPPPSPATRAHARKTPTTARKENGVKDNPWSQRTHARTSPSPLPPAPPAPRPPRPPALSSLSPLQIPPPSPLSLPPSLFPPAYPTWECSAAATGCHRTAPSSTCRRRPGWPPGRRPPPARRSGPGGSAPAGGRRGRRSRSRAARTRP